LSHSPEERHRIAVVVDHLAIQDGYMPTGERFHQFGVQAPIGFCLAQHRLSIGIHRKRLDRAADDLSHDSVDVTL
jgi:hypothetical protein